MTGHTLTSGEKPPDFSEILKDVRTYKLIQGMNGYTQIITKDKQAIKKLKDLGFTEADN